MESQFKNSIHYYDHHADLIAREPWREGPVLAPFLSLLKTGPASGLASGLASGASQTPIRVVDLGCGSGGAVEYMGTQGLEAYGIEGSSQLSRAANQKPALQGRIECRDLLFWSPKKAEWDGVWIQRTLQHFTPEAAQRVVGAAFQGLRVGGILGVVVPEGDQAYEDRAHGVTGPTRWMHPFREQQICSMIEQTGFRVLKVGRRPLQNETELLILAQRI